MWCKYNVKETVGDKALNRPYFAMFCFTLQEMEAKI